MLAVLVAALVEHQVRHWIAPAGQLLHGLMPEGRDDPIPTPRCSCVPSATTPWHSSAAPTARRRCIIPSSVLSPRRSGPSWAWHPYPPSPLGEGAERKS